MLASVALFFIFILLFISISLVGFLVAKEIHPDLWENHLTHESVGISGSILDVLAIFVSVPLSFVLVFVWNTYNTTLNNIRIFINQLELMFVKARRANIDISTCVEYLETHKIKYLHNFKQLIYESENQQFIKFVDQLNPPIIKKPVSQEIWYVIVVGVIAVILGTWLVKSPIWLHIYLIVSVAAILGTLVFLIFYYDNLLLTLQQEQQSLQLELLEKMKRK